MGLLTTALKTAKDWVEAGYPEEVAKRIASGELPMDEASRIQRAQDQGYGDVLYRGHYSPRAPKSNQDMWMSDSYDNAFTYADAVSDGTVTPLRHNADNLAYVNAGGKHDRSVTTNNIKNPGIRRGVVRGTDDISEAVKYSDEYQGTYFEGLRDDMHNTSSTERANVYNILGSRDDVNIRHADAAYDPKYTGPNIMGGLLAGGVGLGALGQSEDADASLVGLLSKNASRAGAKAAEDVFNTHMQLDPEIFTDWESLIESGATQSSAARRAGNSRQGWFIGSDGKPRYEISDAKASIDRDFTKGVAQKLMDKMPEGHNYTVPLRKFLTHDSLFNAYPELAELPLMLRHPRDLGDTMGVYHVPHEGLESGGMSLNLGPVVSADRNETLKTVMHELQHAIQQKEGFARGSSNNIAIKDIESYLSDPARHGSVNELQRESLLPLKREWPEHLVAEAAKGGDDADIASELAYYMSSGEAEARAVENRLRMPAKLRATDHGHPYGDMRWPKHVSEWITGDPDKGPTLFEMIEMLTYER